MRHRVGFRKLGRKTEHRIATLRNLATSLIEHEKIETTLEKAKELRPFAERLISKARTGSVHARRIVSRDIHDQDAVKRLFDEVAPRFMDRPGGYTRIIRWKQRRGDNADMAIIELVERRQEETKSESEKPAAKKSGLGGLARRLSKKG